MSGGSDVLLHTPPGLLLGGGGGVGARSPEHAAAKEAIHSGHFMVSNFEPDEEAEEERLNAPILADYERLVSGGGGGAPGLPEVRPPAVPVAAQLSIDGSLTKLFNTLTIAYNEQISNPRWNMFKGMKLNMKDKIRLNNVIWRCWHIQFVKRQNRGVCHFASSPEGEQRKPDTVVLEGKYWKRKPEAVTAEYKKWRMFHKNRLCRAGGRGSDPMEPLLAPPTPEWPAPLSSSLDAQMDMDLDFSDGLMDMLMQQPYTFPNPREIRVGCADFIQPSLVQLQPNLTDLDLMDTLEPLQDLLSCWQDSRAASRLPTVDEEPPAGCSPTLPLLMDQQTVVAEPSQLPPPVPPVPPTLQPAATQLPLPLQPTATQLSPAQPLVVAQPPPQPASQLAPPHAVVLRQPLLLGESAPVRPTKQQLRPQPIAAKPPSPLRRSGADVLRPDDVVRAVPVAQMVLLPAGAPALVTAVTQPQSGLVAAVTQPQPGLVTAVTQAPPQRELRQRSHSHSTRSMVRSSDGELQRRSSLSEIQRARAAGAMQRSVSDSSGVRRVLAQPPVAAAGSPPVTMLSQLLSPSRVMPGSPPPRLPSPAATFSAPSPPEAPAPPTRQREQRRAVHINAEQKRRGSIKSGFDVLYSLVPALQNSSAGKVSKAAMLHQGADYIRELKAERSKLTAEAEELRREIDRLQQEIVSCQALLPATGAPVSRARQTKMQEMFDEYVRERTMHNWRFFVFSQLLPPLLDSYNRTVSTASLEELCRTVLCWQEQSCGLVQLRPRATAALCHLSRTTSILADPHRLPMEAVNAVSGLRRLPAAADRDAAATCDPAGAAAEGAASRSWPAEWRVADDNR